MALRSGDCICVRFALGLLAPELSEDVDLPRREAADIATLVETCAELPGSDGGREEFAGTPGRTRTTKGGLREVACGVTPVELAECGSAGNVV